MSVFAYSKLYWIHVLFSITSLFCGSELGCEATLIQSRSCENISKLSEDNETQNLSSSEMGVYETKPYTWSTKHESSERTVRWNNITVSAREFQIAYCSTQCHGNLIATPQRPDLGYRLECFPCDCSNRLCEFYGTCCPEYFKPSMFTKTVSGETPEYFKPPMFTKTVSGETPEYFKPPMFAKTVSGETPEYFKPPMFTKTVSGETPEYFKPPMFTKTVSGETPEYFKPPMFTKTVSGDAPNTTPKHWLGSNITGNYINVAKGTISNLICDGPSNGEQVSARWCPSNYPDDDVKSKCQDDIPSAEQAIDTFLHVADVITGRSFYNQYCAACHKVQQLTPWNLSVECFSYTKVYMSRTPEELFGLSLAKDSDCIIVQTPPAGLTPYSCFKVWFATTIIDTCNVTGEWEEYDEDIAEACEDVSCLVNRVRDPTSCDTAVYKNVFCAMCNKKACTKTGADSSYPDQTIGGGGSSQTRLPFSVLLNFGSRGSLESQKPNLMRCSQDSYWTSPDNKCLPLQCSPGKILTNGTCTTAFNQIRGLVYQIHVVYVPIRAKVKPAKTENSANLHSTYLDLFTTVFEKAIYLVASQFQITVTMIFSNQTLATGENAADKIINTTPMNCFVIDGYIRASVLLGRDEMETHIVRELLINNITVDIDTNTTLTFVPTLHPHRHQKYPNCNYRDKESQACMSSALPSNRSNLYNIDMRKNKQAIVIEPQLTCPFVQFSKTDYVYLNETTAVLESVSITVFFKNARMTFSGRTELNMASVEDNETLRICLELLNTTNVIRSKFSSHSLLKLVLYVLTLMCVISSIICLAITIMTYFLFSVLRSLAGKNNMFLCGNLLLAQISLLATSHVQESGYLCTILAVCTHFLWLAMFCWCFTCCFHMFCVFSAKTRSIQTTTISEMVYMIKRVVACSVIPGLIVAAVIATNLTISGKQFLGYGNSTCFIDSQITLIITLVVPLCLVLLFNFIFFSITVIKIYQVRKLQTREFRKDDHNNLYIYIKLSSMTGIFWVLSVISEATDNDPLRFISIGLNGLQGVFIFLSYICNRRVLKLYLKLLGLETNFPTTSTSDRSTIAKVVADVDKN